MSESKDTQKLKSLMKWAHESVETSSNCVSRFFFLWSNKLISLGGLVSGIQEEHVFDTKESDKFRHNYPIIKDALEANMKKGMSVKDGIITKTILSIVKWQVFLALFFLIFANVLQFVGPVMLKSILRFMKSDDPSWYGIVYALIIFFSFFIRGIFQQHGFHILNSVGYTILSGLEGLIFDKVMKLKCSSIGLVGTGKIINLATVDVMGIQAFTQYGSFMVTAPIMIVVSLILIINEVGWVGLVGVIVLFFGSFSAGKIGFKQMALRAKTMKFSDRRAKMMTEYINGMRILKYQGWEKFALKNINEIRQEEAINIKRMVQWRNLMDVVTALIPGFISIAVFGAYTATGETLTPEKAFSVLGYFNLLQGPLKVLGFSIQGFINLQVNFRRINYFFGWQDKNQQDLIGDIEKGALKIVNGSFAWETQEAIDYHKKMDEMIDPKKKMMKDKLEKKAKEGKVKNKDTKEIETKVEEKNELIEKEKNKEEEEKEEKKKKNGLTILKNININVEKGQFIGIIGKVGSGKSSLISCLINEMHTEQGEIHLNPSSKIALVTQQAWLMNTTLQKNILFGHKYNEEKYNNIIKICELVPDLEQLEGGDQTEIGERGINLSGGQKQRIAIARAVYADADIYIIDDCLSALDNYVSNKIFNNVLKTHLKDKTRIFVTHALQYIPTLDSIIVMSDGQIVQQNTYEKLQEEGGEFNNLLQILDEKQEESNQEDQEDEEQQIESIADMVQKSIQQMEDESISQYSVADETVNKTYAQKQYTKKNNANNNENESSMYSCGDEHKSYVPKQEVKSFIQSEDKYKEEELQDIQNIQMVESKKNIRKTSNKVSSSNQNIRKKSSITDLQKEKLQSVKMEKGVLSTTEKSKSGAVSSDVYKYYIKQSGTFNMVILLFMFIFTQACIILNDVWLGLWSKNQFNQSTLYYIIGFALIALLTALSVFTRGFVFAVFIYNNAIQIQKSLVNAIFRSTMGWFDVTPSGRILNRTNKDQDDIDSILPWTLSFCTQNIFGLLGYLVLVSIVFPLFLAIFLFVSLGYMIAIKRYIKVAREIKRIEALKRSPALSLIGETSNGCVMIRNANKEHIFMQMVDDRFDAFIKASANTMYCSRWISMVSDIFSSFLIGSVAILAVLSKEINYTSDPAFIGVALTNVFKVTQILSFTIKILSDTELQFNAVERVKEYIDKEDLEAPWEEPALENMDWPERGEITASNLKYKYRQDTPLVIKGIAFSIQSFEKIGVVGRTGSGKSTLTLGLLRILELAKESQQGSICIDGVDISKVGLHHLRQKLSIIPQDPFLFTGELRKNIDPFDEYSDQAIIDSLKAVTIWEQIGSDDMTSKQKLQYEITDGGSNFSLGQRQLICMSRSILRRSRVLIMDEATASIDEATDNLIQTMIKDKFTNTTVITIAHRINTIINYDRLMILHQGTIVQFDTPYNLLQDKAGYFYSIVMESGQEYFDTLMQMIDNQK